MWVQIQLASAGTPNSCDANNVKYFLVKLTAAGECTSTSINNMSKNVENSSMQPPDNLLIGIFPDENSFFISIFYCGHDNLAARKIFFGTQPLVLTLTSEMINLEKKPAF